MAIYNDIITVSVNPLKGFFRSGSNPVNVRKKLAKLAIDEFLLRNREKFLATFEKFVTI